MINILGIETSCDDTSAAIVNHNFQILSNIISSQEIHNKYGGIVPEIASRQHIINIVPVVDNALKQAKIEPRKLSAVAVSTNPGLIGSLIVGVSFAKSFAYTLNIPLLAINHILGHVYANFLHNRKLETPFIALVASGGHTELVKFDDMHNFTILGRTRDDAAGEAFDKIGKLLNLPYPGGPEIDKLSKKGNRDFVKFPRALNIKEDYDFSYSGLKTSVITYLSKQTSDFIAQHLADICASAQAAIVDIMITKTIAVARKYKIKQICVAGGVAANSELRNLITKQANKFGINVSIPEPILCTDNGAMIAAAGIDKFKHREFSDLKLNAFSTKGIRIL
ncbi:MAG: tRNA (adenosine(37)-N6)-threonylcarbamoyltransferase complex transferase subunit TsaD [Candidatus Cloacimonadota bacterium]|nr:MAG: tRNA (adenosine(37)-N6)-threonylcarbamoyltransferase complex transferase subunit TsaD [Candidatus Cloacimonadota bacterium]